MKKLLFVFLGLGVYYSASCMELTNYNDDFIQACKKNDLEAVKKYIAINQNFDINTKDKEYGYTGLMWSCIKYYSELTQILIDAGADPTVADNTGCTVFKKACAKNNINAIVLFFMQGKVDLHIQLNSLMMDPKSNTETINALIKYGANLDIQDKNGNTLLNMLCSDGHSLKNRYQMIKILLKAKANPTIANKEKSTALHPLCNFPSIQNFNAIQLFISYAPHYLPQLLGMENNSGETPLTLAQGMATNRTWETHNTERATEMIKLLKPYKNAENTIEVVELNNSNNNQSFCCTLL